METLIEYVEILGAVAFSISGAAKAIKNDMVFRNDSACGDDGHRRRNVP